jgi:hypothetical protein
MISGNPCRKGLFAAITLASLITFLAACEPEGAADAEPAAAPDSGRFSLHREEIYDIPIKAQIEQHVVALDVPTQAALEAEVLRRYDAAKGRRGFKHHNTPTNIYIYVYGSEEQAQAAQGLWIAMLAKGPSDKGMPAVQINEDRLAALSSVPQERFGLPEATREEVFRKSAAAEDRAMHEAMVQVPDSDIMNQVALEEELRDKYKADLAAKYGLSDDQLLQIQLEGVTKGWVSQ